MDTPFLFVILAAILYFVVIAPGRKERKQHEAMLGSLMRGDEVLTTGGILGTVTDISDKIITVEIAKNTKIRVLRTAIARKVVEDPNAAAAKPDDKAAGVSKETKPSKT